MHEINEKRERLGEYHCLCVELQSHEDRFFKYFRMSRACFEEMYDLLRPRIVMYTTNWRRPIETNLNSAARVPYVDSSLPIYRTDTRYLC